MSLAEMLGAEDNPFSLFLILILLLGATGYFDQPSKVETEVTGEATPRPVTTLPVWQRRPTERPLVRPFSGERPSREGPKKDLLGAVFEMLGLPKPKKAFALLRKHLTRRKVRHALTHARHKMLQ